MVHLRIKLFKYACLKFSSGAKKKRLATLAKGVFFLNYVVAAAAVLLQTNRNIHSLDCRSVDLF
jgi:hypothetical protein